MDCATLSFHTDEEMTPQGLQLVHPEGCINGDGLAIYLLIDLFFLINFAAFKTWQVQDVHYLSVKLEAAPREY